MKTHPILPDVDIWQRALSRTDPDPFVVHHFGGYVRHRQLFLLGWVRQTLLARVRDDRQFTRLAWVLTSWPDLPTIPRDHEQAAIRMRALRERSIIVRHFKLPRIDQFLRITIGTPEQCRVLVEALREILG